MSQSAFKQFFIKLQNRNLENFINFQMNSIHCLIAVLLVASVSANSSLNISEKIQNQERNFRESIGMTYLNYHLYPFAISSSPQQFVLSFQQIERVKGQISVLWIEGEKNEVIYPEYSQKENINLKIVDLHTNMIVYQKSFYFESGISFEAQPKHQYRIIFQNPGEKIKMIQFSLSYVEPKKIQDMTNTTDIVEYASQHSKEILEEVHNILMKSEEELIIGGNLHERVSNNIGSYYYGCLWEILFIGSLVAGQYYLLKNVLKYDSII